MLYFTYHYFEPPTQPTPVMFNMNCFTFRITFWLLCLSILLQYQNTVNEAAITSPGQRLRGPAWRIEERSLEFSLDENCPVGSELGSVAAYPLQGGGLASSGGPLTYRLGGASSLFAVEPQTGQLATWAVIDAEELCTRARRREKQEASRDKPSASVSAGYSSKFQSPGRIDSEPKDRITCNFDGQLDVHLEVNAVLKDGSLRAVHRVTVHIHDLNDNWPKFEQVRWHRRLKEVLYRKGRRLSLPTARDADLLAEHSRILYRLEPMEPDLGAVNAPFRLEVTDSGQPELLLTEDLDAEVKARHEFVLVAYSPTPVWSPVQVVWESGSSQDKNTGIARRGHEKSSVVTESRLLIDIEVADMNDNEPQFKSPFYNISVAEDTSPTTVIYQLKAYDPDSTAQLSYSMGNSGDSEAMDSTFKVDADGRVRLHNFLDYEQRHTYTLNVQVSDGEFHAKTRLYVHVLDVNDESPKFDINPKQLTAEENAPPGKLIGRVRILDPDSESVNGKVRCHEPEKLARRQPLSFLPDPLASPSSGVYDLTTRFTLDREDLVNKNGRLVVYLICVDGWGISGHGDGNSGAGQHTSTMTATLKISDDNDHTPVFTQSVYHVAMVENNAIGEKVAQVNATDADEGENARITYSLLDRANFKVDSITGWITANMAFDRETRDSYQVTVMAMDQGKPRLSSSVLLNLTILDANDHRPQLASHELDSPHLMRSSNLKPGRVGYRNVFVIRENAPANTYVGDVIATDDDLEENSRMMFTLVKDSISHNHMWFRLLYNGSLYTAMPLDREEKDHYQLEVRVTDQSRLSPLSSTGTIAIIVQDMNDNSPKFIEPLGLLPKNASETEVPAWSLGNNILYDQPAQDEGKDSNDGYQKMMVTKVSEKSEKYPKMKPTIRLSMHENPGFLVVRLRAEDPDVGDNGKVMYQLEEVPSTQPNGERFLSRSVRMLRVESDVGDVTLQHRLSTDDLGPHLFLVKASDFGRPVPKTDQKIFLINVEDIPATDNHMTNLQSAHASSYYSANITSSDITWWNPKNMLLVVVLASISGLLATAVITALLCILGPWRSRRRRHRRPHRQGEVSSQRPNTLPGDEVMMELRSSGNDQMFGPGHFDLPGLNGIGHGNLDGPRFHMGTAQRDNLLHADEWHVSFEDRNGTQPVYSYGHGACDTNSMSSTFEKVKCSNGQPTVNDNQLITQPRYENWRNFVSYETQVPITVGTTTHPITATSHHNSNPWVIQEIPSSVSTDTTTTIVRLLATEQETDATDIDDVQDQRVTPILLLPRSNRMSGIATGALGTNPAEQDTKLVRQHVVAPDAHLCSPIKSATAVGVTRPIPITFTSPGNKNSPEWFRTELPTTKRIENSTSTVNVDGLPQFIVADGTGFSTMNFVNSDVSFLTCVQTSVRDETSAESRVEEHHSYSDSGRGFSEEEDPHQTVQTNGAPQSPWQHEQNIKLQIRQELGDGFPQRAASDNHYSTLQLRSPTHCASLSTGTCQNIRQHSFPSGEAEFTGHCYGDALIRESPKENKQLNTFS